jgi:hypothetical protein
MSSSPKPVVFFIGDVPDNDSIIRIPSQTSTTLSSPDSSKPSSPVDLAMETKLALWWAKASYPDD